MPLVRALLKMIEMALLPVDLNVSRLFIAHITPVGTFADSQPNTPSRGRSAVPIPTVPVSLSRGNKMKTLIRLGVGLVLIFAHQIQAETTSASCGCATPTHVAIATGCDGSGCDMPGCDGAGCEGTGCDTCCAPPSDSNCCDSCPQLGCDTSGDCCDSAGNICSTLAAPSCDDCEVSYCALPCDTGCRPNCGCFKCCTGWSVLAEAIFLTREGSGPQSLIQDQATGGTLVSGDDFDFDHQGAARISIVRDYCNCWGWEVGYLGTDSLEDTQLGGGNVSPALVGPGTPFVSTAPGAVFGVQAGTDLDSIEFNLRRRCHPCVTLIAGFRMIELDDYLRGYSLAPVATDLYHIRTQNQMYGFQLGADAILLDRGSFQITSIARAGVMGNHITSDVESPVLPSRTSVTDNDTGFVGELGLRAGYRLGNGLAFVGGYHMLWLDGVALAPNQLSTTDLTTGVASIDNGSTLFLHGASVGIQARF